MERRVTIGSTVTFIDTRRKQHNALVVCVFGDEYGRLSLWDEETEQYTQQFGDQPSWPALNVVYVSGEPGKDDQYGRQIERDCSVVHLSSNPAGANCWKFLDE